VRAGPPEVLLVEDDADDALMMSLACEGLLDLKRVEDGDKALAYLRGQPPYEGAARPAFVLLDWRLPRRSGEEVLRDIRADGALALLPVIVLTTSTSEHDVRTAYGRGANAYVVKPMGGSSLKELAASLAGFWAGHALLPKLP
jgi:CheY-like chemotaxis protein